MIVSIVDNGTQDRVTLSAATSAVVMAAVARPRTIYIVTTAACHLALGRAATTDDFAMLADDAVFLSLPANQALHAISTPGGAVNVAEVKLAG